VRLLLALAVVAVAIAACASLNPDPVHGGDCRDGDQLGERCTDGVTCCHPSRGERCGLQPRQCIPVDPGPQWLGGAQDAGLEAAAP